MAENCVENCLFCNLIRTDDPNVIVHEVRSTICNFYTRIHF